MKFCSVKSYYLELVAFMFVLATVLALVPSSIKFSISAKLLTAILYIVYLKKKLTTNERNEGREGNQRNEGREGNERNEAGKKEKRFTWRDLPRKVLSWGGFVLLMFPIEIIL